MNNIYILSMPRTGSSMLANLVNSAGYNLEITPDSCFLGASDFNRDGYFEETRLTLLNDQLIRCIYGADYSFLHLPSTDLNVELIRQSPIFDEYSYDIDENTLFVPHGFDDNVQQFTGNDWDNWGLTRMRSGGKWHKCYERYQCKTGKQIKQLVKGYSEVFNYNQSLIVKDPRMSLVFHCYEVKSPRIIVLRRNKEATLKSMKQHYGKNIFTENKIQGTNYCSNHFNYKIEPQSFESYIDIYEESFRHAIASAEYLELDYEDITLNGTAFDQLDDFLGNKVNRSLVKGGMK